MPCNNITEMIRLRLDHNNHFIDYSLTKQSCDRAIGESSLINKLIKGRTVEQILDITAESILPGNVSTSTENLYLYTKHLQIIQSVLAIWLGQRDGQAGERCVIDAINHDEAGIELIAIIKLNLHTENIISCGQIGKNNF
jgi:hypothetical protein